VRPSVCRLDSLVTVDSFAVSDKTLSPHRKPDDAIAAGRAAVPFPVIVVGPDGSNVDGAAKLLQSLGVYMGETFELLPSATARTL